MPEASRRRRKRSAETTIFDVAQKAGVSISTVSLALRGSRRLAAKTRAAVLKAAGQLRYQPNVAAQSLARRSSNLIAVCGYFDAESLNYNSYASIQMLTGIMGRLKDTRYAIYVVNWSTHPMEHHRLLTDISKQRFICGSIWLTADLGPRDKRLAQRSGAPLCLAEGRLPGIDSVTVDNVSGARMGVKHLLRSPYQSRRLVLVTGNPKTQLQSERLKGVKQALSELGLSGSKPLHFRADFYSFTNGESVAAELARLVATGAEKAGYAVFCLAGDWCAMGILQGLKNAGIAVPTQVSLLGYDGMLQTAFVSPSLSTIKQPLYDMGFAAAGAILDRVENPKVTLKQLRLDPLLVARSSA
jgi:DNA-binding LacI/PurR family transcriptional regulator